MGAVHNLTDAMIQTTEGKKVYPGELATRLIDLLVLEYADKTSHCSIDPVNASEIALGEIVLGCGMEYRPINNFYKSMVFALGDLLGAPDYIINRNPINSTFGTDKIHSYFGEIPKNLSAREVYEVLDCVLFNIFDKKIGPKKIAQELGHSLGFVEKVYQRVMNQDHRRDPPCFVI